MNPISDSQRVKIKLYRIVREQVIIINMQTYSCQWPVCERCRRKITLPRHVHCDHIYSRHTGRRFLFIGMLNPRNMQILCPSCHRTKTDGRHKDYRSDAGQKACAELSDRIYQNFSANPYGGFYPNLYVEAFEKTFTPEKADGDPQEHPKVS